MRASAIEVGAFEQPPPPLLTCRVSSILRSSSALSMMGGSSSAAGTTSASAASLFKKKAVMLKADDGGGGGGGGGGGDSLEAAPEVARAPAGAGLKRWNTVAKNLGKFGGIRELIRFNGSTLDLVSAVTVADVLGFGDGAAEVS